MLQDVFSLRGRIGRLHFFVGSVLLTILSPVIFLALAVVGPGLADPRPHNPIPFILIGVVASAFAITWIWLGISLHARRIRDIGWSPAPIVVGWLAFRIVDAVVAFQMTSHRTGLVVVDYGFWLILMLMPGRGGDADEAAPRPPRRDARDGGALPMARASFGRRGLS